MDFLIQDLRYSLRTWRKRPGFVFVVVLTLAFGIGANSAIFSVVEGVLLRALPYQDPERLVVVRTELVEQGSTIPRSSGPEILDLRQQASFFQSLAGVWARPGALTDDRSEPEEVQMGFVTAGFLSVLGVKPILGRFFLPEEDVLNAPPVMMLSHGLWQRRYGGDPQIVGSSVELDGQPHTVVGVMPARLRMFLPPEAGVPERLEAWVPWGGGYDEMSRAFRVFTLVGRLKQGRQLSQARMELSAIAARIAANHPEAYQNSGLDLHLTPLHAGVTGQVRPTLLVLWGTVGFVLLIACANVANLFLVRATSLEGQIMIRRALGASRRRLFQQLLTETLLLAILGGLAGLLLAYWGIDLLRALEPGELPRLEEVRVDGRLLGVTSLLTLLSGLVVGTLCALNLTNQEHSFGSNLKTRSVAEGGRHRLRRALVVSELSLSLVLLIGAGLLLRSYHKLGGVEMGFDSQDILTAKLSLIDHSYPYSNPQKIGRFYHQFLHNVAQLNGVEAVGATSQLPLDGVSRSLAPYAYQTDSGLVEWESVVASYRTITPGWMEALKVKLKQGRLLEWTDDLEHPYVAIVDENLARKAWPGQSAVGKRLQVSVFLKGPTWAEVVGVVEHVRHQPGHEEIEQVFLPHRQSPLRTMTVALRSSRPQSDLANALEAEVRALEKTQPIHAIRPLEAYRAEAVAVQRFTTSMLGAFAVMALALASVGTYGVMAFAVGQRTQEIGIRMALGADPGRILRVIIGEGVLWIATGVAAGCLGALAMTRFLSNLLFGVSSTDPTTFLGVPLLLVLVALAALFLPARRAAQVDPATALRKD